MNELEKLRHSAAHVLASAVKELFPNAKLAIGPPIENGFYYDFDFRPFTPEDLKRLEKKMQEIIKKNLPFKKTNKTKKEAEQILKDEPYKLELLKDLKEGEITFYSHGGFQDLCAGPHISSTIQIKAFKLLKTAGAYWRGDSKNKQLQRIYGTAFPSEKELRVYLHNLQEAEKRDHRKIGQDLGLFSFHQEAPGFPFFHAKGRIIWNELETHIREEIKKDGYIEVKTPFIFSNELWKISGHWDHYKDNMYFTKIDDEDFAVKPMNCPGHILIYKTSLHSYKELPIRMAETGTVHRHELSGVIGGLLRVRHITQDDAHIFCTEEQIESEIIKVINLIIRVYNAYGFKKYKVELSTRPKIFMGEQGTWDKAEKALMNSLKKTRIEFQLNEGEGAFYGPKIDFHIKDAIGRTWQCATIQLDFQMPLRFELTYEGYDGKKHTPIMIHRAILGSLERFMGILIEHYAGKFPVWLAPVQVKILTVSDKNKKFAKEIYEKLLKEKIRVELDDRSESIGRKVRDSQLEHINYVITIGDKEQKSKTVAIRTLDGKVKFSIKVNSFVKDILNEIEKKK